MSLEDAHCPLGCTAEDTPIVEAGDRLHQVPGRFKVVRCRHCGLMRTSPRPTPESISSFYPDDYEPFQYTRTAAVVHQRPLWRRAAKWILDTYSMHIPQRPPGAVFEVGCASGAFLQYMKDLGWEVEGLEPSAQAAAFARERGLDVKTGGLGRETSFQRKYDLFVAWMVIEHLHDPVGGLAALRAAAKPNAQLCFSVPNAGALEFGLFRERWFALQVPTHLFHFTPRTISLVLERAGWTVERIFFHRSLSIEIASAAYVAEDLGLRRLSHAFRKASQKAGWIYGTAPLSHLAARLGQTGAMTIWAQPSTPLR